MKNSVLVASALALSVALGACAKMEQKSEAQPQAAAMEHCYGVAKAGGNDCKSGAHACAGHSTVDGDPDSFVALPAGTCGKLAGGVVGS